MILRLFWGKLGVKWTFGDFLKSKHVEKKFGLDPPPLNTPVFISLFVKTGIYSSGMPLGMQTMSYATAAGQLLPGGGVRHTM